MAGMDQPPLRSLLADLNLPDIRYFSTIGSTNDEALRWLDEEGSDRSVVVADEQTAGRGRLHRHWVTIPGAGLAFSILLTSPPLNPRFASRLTGLGALAVCHALALYGLIAQVKWPNDVLLFGRKVAGILAEAHWNGENLRGVIVGIGINIAPSSISQANLPMEMLNFPVTSVENALGHSIDRWELLHAALQGFFNRLSHLASPDFISDWATRLAYLNEWVELSGEYERDISNEISAPAPREMGKILGLASDGSLKLLTRNGKQITVRVGDIRLHPIESGNLSSYQG